MLRKFYREIWCVDFEFSAPLGEVPQVVCMVAREVFSRRTIRLFGGELSTLREAPFSTRADVLVVAYYASAEMGCFLSLGWPMPRRLLDLFTEYRRMTNGLGKPAGLLAAGEAFGLHTITASEKDTLRDLAIRGGPYTSHEQTELLNYCQSDVELLVQLLLRMEPHIDLPRALLRGRYMQAVARMEHTGIPVDAPLLARLRTHWRAIRQSLVAEVDAHYGVFDGTTFKQALFAEWLQENRIPWPRTPAGHLATDEETFRQQAKAHPQVSMLRELLHVLSKLKLNDLAVGPDGRNRCLLSPFRSRTGRNQPSNSEFIFGPSVWLRGLIRPTEGRAIAYIDWSQQELGIVAKLSGDRAMQEAYRASDPYLAFAKQAGAVPDYATKDSHPNERKQFKVCSLAVQYGMGAESLGHAIGRAAPYAKELLGLHRSTYPQYWRWADDAVNQATLSRSIGTVFGWTMHVGAGTKINTLRNYPAQANGAEMLRLACCLCTEQGILVAAPVHDAILIESSLEEIESDVARAQAAMREASRIVLDGFELGTDAEIIRWPDRYMDEDRGRGMWDKVMAILNRVERSAR